MDHCIRAFILSCIMMRTLLALLTPVLQLVVTEASTCMTAYRPIPQTLVVSGTAFSLNKKGAVFYYGNTNRDNGVLKLESNHFVRNQGPTIEIQRATSTSNLFSLADNLFKENDCKDKSVIDVLRLDDNFKIENNTFTKNRAKSVMRLQVIRFRYYSLQRRQVSFKNNTLSNNIAYNTSRPSNAGDSCAVVLSGILHFKEVYFHFNKFNNSKYLSELCVRVPVFSANDVINVTFNWWATTNSSEVHDRIWDYDDNYDFAIANYWPFLLSSDDRNITSLEPHYFKQQGNVLSGRLFHSLTLKHSYSPYRITSDLTILKNVTLTVEAGVTVTVRPGVSILVTGALQAKGTLSKPVLFTVMKPAGSNKTSQLSVRLVNGEFPWEGRPEVLHVNAWKPIAGISHVIIGNIAVVVCSELGYGQPLAHAVTRHLHVNGSTPVGYLCHGNETSLHECTASQRVVDYSSVLHLVKCQGVPWGNVRFVTSRNLKPNYTQSVLSHVEFSHCGHHHGVAVPAIEVVTGSLKLHFVTVRNCTSGGLRIYSPTEDVHINNCMIVNSRETGISFVQSQKNILVENSESSRNKRGISFGDVSAENVHPIYHGQEFLCSERTTVVVSNQKHFLFGTLWPKITLSNWLTCEKVLKVPKGQGIKLKLLYFKGRSLNIRVYYSSNRANLIMDGSAGLSAFVEKDLFIPRDTIFLHWFGNAWYGAEVVFLLEGINITGK